MFFWVNLIRYMQANGKKILFFLGITIIISIIIWQTVSSGGSPNPADESISSGAAILSCGLLVFREGLEAILVLAAITATVSRTSEVNYKKGISIGIATGLLATIVTWFVVVLTLSSIDLPALDIQAATGLLAIVVLLLVMNWFFHKVYWTGWISNHTRRGKKLINSGNENPSRLLRGFILLGFTAIYREGFEIVLFLQQLRLEKGDNIVFIGAGIGLLLTSIVAVTTFIANEKLPYRKMLVLTGILLGIVLLVMVGESVQEIQQAGWIPSTPINIDIPVWISTWFAIFPNLQNLLAQLAAAFIVIGSYVSSQYKSKLKISH